MAVTGVLLAALCAVLIGGCSTLRYYGQSISGQLQVLDRRRPIAELLQSDETPQPLKKKLDTVLRIRDFASAELGLPDNRSYRSYTDLHRSFVVWNVVATPEFSLEPKKWCFAVVGCLSYRGYFSEHAAQQFADGLRRQGYDVFVGGVAAYSTLGWFDDPLLNTMLDWPEDRLAGLIFHELTHQELYIPGDTTFNESLAVTVQDEGTRRWLAYAHPDAVCAYVAEQRREEQFLHLVWDTRRQLTQLYESGLPRASMVAGKARIFRELKTRYAALRRTWGGYGGYDGWFKGPVNNAKLAALATYRQYVPAFRALLAQQGGDLPAFFRAAHRLAKLPAEQRAERLATLAAQPVSLSGPDCPAGARPASRPADIVPPPTPRSPA